MKTPLRLLIIEDSEDDAFMDTPEAFVLTTTDSGSMIGAATGLPLRYEVEKLTEPFAGTSYSVDEMFYIGEVLFYPPYRDQGLGIRLLKRIEEYVRNLGKYRYLTCATVERPENHKQRPENYVSIDRFLSRTNFIKLPGITTSFAWKETDGNISDHQMQFWVKELFL